MFELGILLCLGFYFGRMGIGIVIKYVWDLESFIGFIVWCFVLKSIVFVCYYFFLGVLLGKFFSMGVVWESLFGI